MNSMTLYQANRLAHSLQQEAQRLYIAGDEEGAIESLNSALAMAVDYTLEQQITDDLYRLEFNQEP